MAGPSGNDVIRSALAVLMERLTQRGHRWTREELDLIARAEAALGGAHRFRPARGLRVGALPQGEARPTVGHGGG